MWHTHTHNTQNGSKIFQFPVFTHGECMNCSRYLSHDIDYVLNESAVVKK